MRTSNQVAKIREFLIKNALVDVCQLIPKQGTNIIIGGSGVLTQTPATAKIWRGTTNIPCLFYIARAFRPDLIPAQTVVTTEYNLDLPFDAPVDEDDIVVINNVKYEIRRLVRGSKHTFVIEALIFTNTSND